MSNEPTSAVGPGSGPGASAGGNGGTHDAPTSRLAQQPGYSEPVPERVGPYKVVREIGRGGMGSVLLAIKDDDKFAKTVAIKLVKRGMDTSDILHRFNVERQVLIALNHPNIARVFDAGASADGRPYFVMEHVDGLPITTYCDSNQLSTAERLKLFEKVCSAVHHAHQNLVVHRDLKPGNILVDPSGEPKLLDFGIAKLLNADLLGTPMVTGPELRLMTPEYASPEQVQGLPISTASDVYSLGVLLYELLTGHAPYRFRTRVQEEIVRIVCEVEPEKPSTAVSRVEEVMTAEGTTRTLTPEDVAKARELAPQRLKRRLVGDLDNIVLMAMRKGPKRRYQSAEQFAEDIQRHLDGRPVIARRDTFVYRTGKFVVRNRWGVAAAAAMLALLVLGAAGTTMGMLRARAERDRAVIAEKAAVAAETVATQRFEMTKGAVSDFLEDYAREIRKTRGSTPARRLLVQTSVKMLNGLEARAKDDAAIRSLFSTGYQMLGDLQAGLRGGGDADNAGAAESYTKALAARKTIAAAGDAEAQRRVAATLIGLADVQVRLKKPADAAAGLDEAIALMRRQPATDNGARRLLAVALVGKGDMLFGGGKDREAEKLYEESFEIRSALAKGRDTDADVQRDLSTGYLRLAQVAEKKGDAETALGHYTTALNIRKKFNDPGADNGRAQRDELRARQAVVRMLRQQEPPRLKDAIEQQEGIVQLYRAIYEDDQSDVRAMGDLAGALLQLADARYQAGNAAAAADAAGQSLVLVNPEIARGSKDQRITYIAAQAEGLLGDIAAGKGETAEASARFAAAISRVEGMGNTGKAAVDEYLGELRTKLRSAKAKP